MYELELEERTRKMITIFTYKHHYIPTNAYIKICAK